MRAAAKPGPTLTTRAREHTRDNEVYGRVRERILDALSSGVSGRNILPPTRRFTGRWFSGDAEAAEKAVRQHVVGSKRLIVDTLAATAEVAP